MVVTEEGTAPREASSRRADQLVHERRESGTADIKEPNDASLRDIL